MLGTERGCVPVERLGSTVRQNWHMGFTSFGGPPVHFKIVCTRIAVAVSGPCSAAVGIGVVVTDSRQFYDKFAVRLRWLDEQVVSCNDQICRMTVLLEWLLNDKTVSRTL